MGVVDMHTNLFPADQSLALLFKVIACKGYEDIKATGELVANSDVTRHRYASQTSRMAQPMATSK